MNNENIFFEKILGFSTIICHFGVKAWRIIKCDMGRSVCNIVVRLYHGVYINLFRTYICDEINTMEALFFMSPLQIFMGSMQAFCRQGLKTTNWINTGNHNHLL